MVVLDEDFGTNLTLVEGNGGVRLSPVSVPEHAPRDWRSQCERERARADAAEARAEELRWAEVAARSDGGSWKSRFKACRRRLSEAVEETKEARRTARAVPSLQAEVARLETLLSEAGIASAFDTAGALRKENARLRKALAASKAREGAAGPWPAPPRRRTVLEPSPDQKETVRSLRTELRRLDKEVVRRDKENAPAEHAPRPGEGEDGAHQGDREEAVQRVPSAPSGGEDTGRQRGPGPIAVRRGLLAAPCPGGVQGREGEVEGPARQASGGRGDAVEAAVRRGCPTARGVEAVAASEDDDRGAAQGQRPSAQDRAGVGDPKSGAGGSACQASRDQEGTRVRACRASGGQEDVVEVAVRCRRRSPQGSAKVAAPEGYDQVAVPGRTPACARARRRRGTGSRRWKSSLRGFVRPGRCCRGRSTAARASSRTSRARNTSAASSAARPATAAPSGPGSMSAPKSTTRRRMRASAAGAGSSMRRTAPRNPPSSRSRSRPTSA